MRRIFGTRCCKGRFSKDCWGCAGGTVSFLPHRLSSTLRGPHFCADRNGGKNGQGACGPHWIPGVMFYSDLTNRCSTCSHWYSARILIRGGVLTHCFRLFVPTAGAEGTLRFVQCMPNGGQSCTVQRPLCVKGAVSFRGPGEAQRQRLRWGEEEQRNERAFAHKAKRGIWSLRRRGWGIVPQDFVAWSGLRL